MILDLEFRFWDLNIDYNLRFFVETVSKNDTRKTYT